VSLPSLLSSALFASDFSPIFSLFLWGYSVSGEEARLWLWIWIRFWTACSRCGPANGLRFGFLALGLGIDWDGMGWEEDVSTEGGVVYPQSSQSTSPRRWGCAPRLRPGDVDVQAGKGNRGADGCRWDAGVGAVPCVGVGAKGISYAQGRDQHAVYGSRKNPNAVIQRI
jgi:hypothetical protein